MSIRYNLCACHSQVHDYVTATAVYVIQRFMTTWVVVTESHSLYLSITGDHSNQDPRCTEKPIYYTIFAKHIWS